MTRATISTVSRPQAFSAIAPLNFAPGAAGRLAAGLTTAGAIAWRCRRGGLVVLHGARRLRLVHDPTGQPATMKTIVGLVEASRHIEVAGAAPTPPKRKARSVAAAGLLK